MVNNIQNNLKLSEIKTLLLSAKNNLHSQLQLNKTKNIKYCQEDYFEVINFLSLFNCCAEDGSQTMNLTDDVPCGDAILQQIKKLDFENLEQQFHKIFKKQFYKKFPRTKKGKKYKAEIIIDVHEQETYSKQKRKHKNIRGGKHKNGTNFFFKYMTMQIMIKDKILTLGVKLYRRGEKQYKLVDELIQLAKKFVKIKIVLLDRGFRDVKILNNLEYRGAEMLMPCFKDKKSRKCFDELRKKNFGTIRYLIKNPKQEIAGVRLVMIRLSNGKEIGFYTTKSLAWLYSAKYFLNLYKKRWNIETGYRLQNSFLPRTTSINECVRMFYFCYACAMHNLWLMMRTDFKVGKLFTVLKMKIVLVLFWVTTHLPYDW